MSLSKGSVVSIVGAGGKTSLLFHLGAEARSLGYRACLSTTTKMLIPEASDYDRLDLSGEGFSKVGGEPAIYVAGQPVSEVKMRGISVELLQGQCGLFDMVFLEADGAAGKSLKGWLPTEPVIQPNTSHTIGVVDITSVGKTVDDWLVHRLDLFCKITGAQEGDSLGVQHLRNMITHEKGLFYQARGERILYINKVETAEGWVMAKKLAAALVGMKVYMGSVFQKSLQPYSS